jgi:hypothetical protein
MVVPYQPVLSQTKNPLSMLETASRDSPAARKLNLVAASTGAKFNVDSGAASHEVLTAARLWEVS